MNRAPRVFVSYSHDNDPHKQWVLHLATDLRSAGIDATLDLWDLRPGQDIVRFMEQGISDSDRVVLVCSDAYVKRANTRQGGVGYEGLIITGELVSNVDTKKFIPVIRNQIGRPTLPTYLGPRYYLDFRDDGAYNGRLDELIREIYEIPALQKPSLGPNPFTTAISPASPIVVPRRCLIPGHPAEHIFMEAWFDENRKRAMDGLRNNKLSASMEVSFVLASPVNNQQDKLLEAAYNAQIHTFGWPLGVVLDNRPEFRPRATRDGIVAEIALGEDEGSYDYWAVHKSGDYFLLNSLFEDKRRPHSIFMDTRIVRTTEGFLLCDNFYRNLGLKDDAIVGLQIAHRGLEGRTLTTATPRRHIHPETTQEDASETTMVMQLVDIKARLVDNVITVLEPLFMLFNFKKFDRTVYEDIVMNYASGRIV